MVTQAFTSQMAEQGAALLRKLDAAGIKTTAALWIYLETSDTWRFLVASPDVQSKGPKQIYERIQRAVGSDTDMEEIRLQDISVVPPDEPLIQLLRVAIRTGVDDVSGIRFRRNTINGQVIEDAYIYRLT